MRHPPSLQIPTRSRSSAAPSGLSWRPCSACKACDNVDLYGACSRGHGPRVAGARAL